MLPEPVLPVIQAVASLKSSSNINAPYSGCVFNVSDIDGEAIGSGVSVAVGGNQIIVGEGVWVGGEGVSVGGGSLELATGRQETASIPSTPQMSMKNKGRMLQVYYIVKPE
jgi:hypothetical protein